MSTLREQMTKDMQLRGFSERTQEAYLRAVRKLAEHYGKSPDKLSEKQVRDYFLFLKNEKRFSPSTMKIAYCGIKFFFIHTLHREWSTLNLVRAERQYRLPDVLTVEEVHAIIEAVNTLHNRTYLWTVYSCGLRLNEGLHLQVSDIDSGRMMVHVHRGKGAKDRYVPLPERTLHLLREYWVTHHNPVWLFPALGRDKKQASRANHPMPTSTAQGALRRAVLQLGLKKRVSVHTLRHSYATHCIEAGINVRIVQQYLGHRSLQTTMLYLHLTSTGQEQAVSRLNELMTSAGAETPQHDQSQQQGESQQKRSKRTARATRRAVKPAAKKRSPRKTARKRASVKKPRATKKAATKRSSTTKKPATKHSPTTKKPAAKKQPAKPKAAGKKSPSPRKRRTRKGGSHGHAN